MYNIINNLTSRYCFPIIKLFNRMKYYILCSIQQVFHRSLTPLDNQRKRNLAIGDPIHLAEDMKLRRFGGFNGPLLELGEAIGQFSLHRQWTDNGPVEKQTLL